MKKLTYLLILFVAICMTSCNSCKKTKEATKPANEVAALTVENVVSTD